MKTLVVLCTLLSIIFASPLSLKSPLVDDFYNPPRGYESAKLGEILKLRKTPGKISSLFIPVEVKNSWQLLVRSEDSFGNAAAIVTTVIEPFNADPSKVVSYQSWEDATNIECSPSYGMQFGAPLSSVQTQVDMIFIVPLLNKGYFVVLPDYEGPKSTFGVGRQSGKATLDSIKAVLKTKDFSGINDDAQVAMWGYSGGTIAAGWAATLQPKYAPELKKNLIGAALGGFVINITATAEATDGTLFAGLIPNALNGLANEFPDFKKRMYEVVEKRYEGALQQGTQHCLGGAILHFAFDQVFTGDHRYFEQGYGLLEEEVFNRTILGNSLLYMDQEYLPDIPIFVYHGSLDGIVPIPDVHGVYKNWCDWGIDSFEFAEDSLNGHLTEIVVGAPAAITWLDARFDGQPVVEGCKKTTRITNFSYPNISDSTGNFFKGIIDSLTASQLGPGVTSDNVTLSGLTGFMGGLSKFKKSV